MLFFFNDTATTEIYTLSLHDALPIWRDVRRDQLVRGDPMGDLRAIDPRAVELLDHRAQRLHAVGHPVPLDRQAVVGPVDEPVDRKSTRLNSSHANISYAVFCLKKKTT